MAQNLVVRATHQIYALWKLCLSIGKNDWELNDYPVVLREQEPDPEYVGTRLKFHRYRALIVNWWAVSGSGDTKEEALQDLDKQFTTQKLERGKSGKALPRPGTRVPIQFASRERVGRHPQLVEDFGLRVLELDWVWVSDESSLWDFHHNETNDSLISKINEIYGVDVSDIQSARLSEIFERIATEQSRQR
jgi:hypothetical protein